MMVMARAMAIAGVIAVVAPGCRQAAAEVVGGTFTDVGNDTHARFFHCAGSLPDGRVLVSGGMRVQLIPTTLVSLDAISFYDPVTATFSTTYDPPTGAPVTPTLATARSSHTQTTLADGRILFTGGFVGASGTSPGTATSSAELFDPGDGGVTAGPAMSAARAAHTASLLPDGRVVVAGGSTWQVFQTTPDGWSASFPLSRTRSSHAAVTLPDHAGPGADRVLLAGGAGNGATTMELLNPDTGGSTLLVSTLSVGVDDLAAGRLDDGTVLIVGGQNTQTGDTVDLTWRLNPVLDSLTAVPPPPGFPDGLSDHELVVTGRFAMVFGGEQQQAGADTELDAVAIYDRHAGDWVFSDCMIDVHDDFASAVLSDGDVLLIDGGVPFLGQENSSANVERFTPSLPRVADVTCDGTVGVEDLLDVLAAWGTCPLPCLPACPEDVDGDCGVGIGDLLSVLAEWG